MKNVNLSEDLLLDCFRIMKGGSGVFLGVKSPWWAKNIESTGSERMKWSYTASEIDVAERVLLVCLPKLDEFDRKILIERCGSGYKKSYRKCGRIVGVHHEVFRQHFQAVIAKLQKLLDEIAQNRA